MPTTKRAGLPTFWTSHLAKVLVGEQPCLLAPWLNGHMVLEKIVRDTSNLAVWKANHTKLLREVVERYQINDWKCDVERFFKVTGSVAIVSGKADLIVQKADKRPKIVDAKSGKPSDSDVCQVAIEMVLVPLAWNSPQMIFEGEVVYPTHTVDVPPATAEALKPKLFEMLRRLGSDVRPAATPSQQSCRFCDVGPDDCMDRFFETTVEPVKTDLF